MTPRSTPTERQRAHAELRSHRTRFTRCELQAIRDARLRWHDADRHLFNDVVSRGLHSTRNRRTLATVQQRAAEYQQAVRDARTARAKRAIAKVRHELAQEAARARIQRLQDSRSTARTQHDRLNDHHAQRLDAELRAAANGLHHTPPISAHHAQAPP